MFSRFLSIQSISACQSARLQCSAWNLWRLRWAKYLSPRHSKRGVSAMSTPSSGSSPSDGSLSPSQNHLQPQQSSK